MLFQLRQLELSNLPGENILPIRLALAALTDTAPQKIPAYLPVPV